MKKNILWSMLLIFVSCSKSSKNEMLVYENFPEISNVTFQDISIPAVIPAVGDLIIVDSTLIVLDMKSDTLFHFFSMPDLKYTGSQINRGQGPNEEIMIVPFLSNNGKNNLLYRTIDKIKIAQIENHHLIVNDTIQLPTEFFNVMHVFKMNDCLFGYDGMIKSENEFICYNLETKEITRFGNYPEIDFNNFNQEKSNILFSKTLISNEDNSMFAALYDKLPLLRIYNKEGVLLKELILKNGQKSPSAYLADKLNQTELNELMINYLKIKATNNYIYGMYAGKTHGELKTSERQNADYGHEIHVWDWNGNPIVCYRLPKAISGFVVSKDDQYIICSSLLNDDKLFRFNLLQVR